MPRNCFGQKWKRGVLSGIAWVPFRASWLVVGRRLWSDVAASGLAGCARAHGPESALYSPILDAMTDTQTQTPSVERPPDMGLAGHDSPRDLLYSRNGLCKNRVGCIRAAAASTESMRVEVPRPVVSDYLKRYQ